MLEELKLKEIVTISDVFEAEVNLRLDFWKEKVSRDKVKGYVPTNTSVAALEAVAKGIAGGKERVHLITGARGTGKSHFGLVLGNFFSLPPKNPAVQSFLQKVIKRDSGTGDSLYRIREQVKPFLIVIPNYEDRDFNHAMNRALQQALREAGHSVIPKTDFAEAIRLLETWDGEEDHSRLLGKALDKEGINLKTLKTQLDKHLPQALEQFKKIHESVTKLPRFAPEFISTAEVVFEDVIRQLRDLFQGIIILYDEFQGILTSLATSPGAASELPVQSFFEWCKRSGQNQCHFVAMAHRSIRDYIRPEIQDQAEKLIGRFSGHGEYLMTNISEGHEIEEMISSLIISSTGHPAWKEISRHGDLNVIIDELQRRALYGDRDAAWLKRTVIEGIFPLHPSALYVLLRLAEVVAQSERTVFRFFSFHQNGGLKHFVDTNDVLYGKRLNFYTVDHLFDYFKDDMERHRGRGRWAMEGFRLTASNSDIRESPQAIRVLKAIAVLQTIADQSKLKTSVEDLMFCLNIPISQRDSFVQLLLKLEQYGLFRAATRDYRFQRRGGVEPRELMEKKREELRNYFVLAKALKEILEEEAIEAQRYNERHGTNRMMPVTYASVGELAHPEAFINRIETSLHDLSRYHGDGMLIRVCPQTPEEVIRSQDMVKSEKWRHPFIIWQVPEAPPGYTEEILELIAWEDVLGEPSLKEDKDQLTEEVDIQRGKIIGKVKRYFSEASKFVWMGEELSGIETVEIVSRAFEQIFPKTPIISDKALAEHIAGKDAEKTYRTNLVSQIISTGGRVELREKSRRAEDRMLRNLFLKNRMIREVSRGQFQVITPPPGVNIYEAWTTLDQVMKQQIVLADTVVERMCLKEYGLTLQTLDLLLGAYICDKSDLYYLVRSPTRWFRTKDMSLISLIDGQNLYNALRKPSEEYTFIFSEVTKDQRWLLEEVKRLFAPGWVPEANLPIWQQAYEALFDQWFKRVPIVSCALIPQKEASVVRHK